MNRITNADRLRGSIGPQICEHLRDIINMKNVTKNLISVITSVILNAHL